MATASLEAKALGEKQQNYASSSGSESEEPPSNVARPVRDGLPQGVLTDFYRTQQSARRREVLEEKKRRELIEKHSATTQSHQEQQSSKNSDTTAVVNLAKALEEGSLAQDPFVQEFRAKRLEEMKKQASLGVQRIIFGNLVEIRGDKYASIIDSAPPTTLVIIHIYDDFLPACQMMNKCLTKLAKLYPTAKFCRVQSYQVGVSEDFIKNGLPAVLVYRKGELLGNLLRVTDHLGQEFTEGDVEGFLQEKRCLPPESEKGDPLSPEPRAVRGMLGTAHMGSDSD